MVDIFEEYPPNIFSFHVVRSGEVLLDNFIVLTVLFLPPPVGIEWYGFGWEITDYG